MSNESDPGRRSAAITEHNTNLIANCRGLWVGTTGDISGFLINDDVTGTRRVWKNIPSGTLLPFEFVLIHADDSTAGDLVAIY